MKFLVNETGSVISNMESVGIKITNDNSELY